MSRANLYEVASTINWRLYPPGHPLWSDINFSPEELHQLLRKEAPLPAQAQLQTSWQPLLHQQPVYQQQQLSRATPPKSDTGAELGSRWSREDDALLHYLQTNESKQQGVTVEAVAAAINRTAMACKTRWQRIQGEEGRMYGSSSGKYNAALAAYGSTIAKNIGLRRR